jgi:hypothetical protein
MAEVIRTVSRVDLEPVRPGREPVVMRGITLVPRHGTPVQITARSVNLRWWSSSRVGQRKFQISSPELAACGGIALIKKPPG